MLAIEPSMSAYFIRQINVKAKNASDLFTYIEEHPLITLAESPIKERIRPASRRLHAR
jgi:hypothetical protein